MSCSSSSTRPEIVAPSDNSCIRSRQRRYVLFPQPDGPMIAVTLLFGNARVTWRTAVLPWKYADMKSVRSRVGRSATMTEARPRGVARRQPEEQDQRHEQQGGAPGQPVPFFEGTGGIGVDLQRERLHRLHDGELEIQVTQRGEQQ